MKNEVFFLMDSIDTTIERKILRQQIKESLQAMEKAIKGDKEIDSSVGSSQESSLKKQTKQSFEDLKKVFEESPDDRTVADFIIHHIDKKDMDTQKKFYTKLFDLTVVSTYLITKYKKLSKKQSVDRQRLIDNLANALIENSYLGNNRKSFNPYYISNKPRAKNPLFSFDFATVQTAYLQHLLLVLVVLYRRWGILPDISFGKMGQKHYIPTNVEKTGDGETKIFSKISIQEHSLIYTIKNFKNIIEKAKQDAANGRRVLINNIFFSRQAIDMLDYDKLINNNHYIVEKENNYPTTVQVRETIALCFEDLIKKGTNRKERVWADVLLLMNILDIKVPLKKNKKMDFHYKSLIGIKNDKGKAFFIKPMISDKDFQRSDGYRRVENLFQLNTYEDMDVHQFSETYTFESSK